MCSSFEEHLNQLDRVLSALESAGLTLNVDKCLFAARETIYLGFKISEGRILPDPEKVRAVAEFPRPTTVTQIRSFVRMASLYRRFIKDFASIAQPLHRLLKKGENVRNQVKWRESLANSKGAIIIRSCLIPRQWRSPLRNHGGCKLVWIGCSIISVDQRGMETSNVHQSKIRSSRRELPCERVGSAWTRLEHGKTASVYLWAKIHRPNR